MDNPFKGEVSLIIGDKSYKLVFDWNALAIIQSTFGRTVVSNFYTAEPKVLASLLCAGLQRHHPEVTENFILQSAPPLLPAIEAIEKALHFAYWGKFPDEPEKSGEGKPDAEDTEKKTQ